MLRRVGALSEGRWLKVAASISAANAVCFGPSRPRCHIQVRMASSAAGIELHNAPTENQNVLGEHLDEDVEDVEELDFVEASLQECHDLSIALHENLQRLGAERTRQPDNRTRRGYYANNGDAMKGMELYHAHMEKLLFHIAQPHVVARMMHSAGQIRHSLREKYNRDGPQGGYRVDQPHRGLKALGWSANSYTKMLRHAPYEAANIRSDMPAHVANSARTFRDNETLRIMRKIIIMRHPRVMELATTWLELVEKAPAASYEAQSIMSDTDEESGSTTTA